MFVGTGSSIAWESGFLAEILSIGGPGYSREAIDATHMGTSDAKVFVPGNLYDGGELSVEIAYNPSATVPIDQPAETVTITWGDSGSNTTAFSGFMTGFEPSVPLEGRATATVTIKVTGVIS